MRRRTLRVLGGAVGAVVLFVVGVFVWQTISYYRDIRGGLYRDVADRRLDASISSAVANAQVTEEDLAALVPTGLFPERGSRSAPITVVEFVDYQCPFCQRSAPAVRKVIDAYGDQVRLIIRDFPITSLHPTAITSARAARCVLQQGQETYWRFHDLLYANSTEQTPENLRVWAQAAGARVDVFAACLADERSLALVNRDIEDGLRVGVQGTPTFFVNGVKFQGALDEKLLSRILNATLEGL